MYYYYHHYYHFYYYYYSYYHSYYAIIIITIIIIIILQINKEPDIRQLNLERERTLEKITGLKGRLDELKGNLRVVCERQNSCLINYFLCLISFKNKLFADLNVQ